MSDTGQDLSTMRHDKVIDLAQERFKKMAPRAISFDAEKGYAIQLLENNDYLMKAAMENKGSLLQAITNVAAIGLSLNPAKKQAYLIPRNMKSGNNWITKVFLEPSYQGLCDLATQSGLIEWVQARCVYANDTFTDNGVGEKPTHEYNAFSKDRGDFVGVYCVAKTTNGDYLTEIMDSDAVNGIMERSESVKAYRNGKTKSGGPWITDFEEMAKKSVIRRAFKTWPKSKEMERLEEAVNLSNENEGFEQITTAPDLGSYTAEQKSYFDQLITQHDSIGMFLFLQSLKETNVSAALFNSFEKGTVTKYKQIVREMESEGYAQLQDVLASVNEAAERDDEHGIIETVEDLSDDALTYLKENASPEAAEMMRSME